MVLLHVLHSLDHLRLTRLSLTHLIRDGAHETISEQHANNHGENDAIHSDGVELVVTDHDKTHEKNASGVDEVARHPEHDQLRAEPFVATRDAEEEYRRDLHVVLRLVVVDEVAITRSPRHVVHVAEGVDDEDVHEGGQHESTDKKHVEAEQVLHHGGQNGEELSVNDGADDGHKRRGEGSHENEGVHSLHGIERHYGSDNDDSPTEHGEEQQRAVGDVGDAIHFLVVSRVVTQRVNELRFKERKEST